jgi:hypothetical protein
MLSKTTAAFILAILAASCAITSANARHVTRHSHRGYARAAGFAAEPARMIQVRPGLWVGSYQCVTDLERGGRDCSSSNP